MTKSLSLFVTCFVLIKVVNSQNVENNLYRNVFYLEGATKASYYSLNYDHIFRAGQKLKISYSVGFSLLKESISFPMGLHFIRGNKEHHPELSLYVNPYIKYYKNVFDNTSTSDKYLFITPTMGYRFQSSRSRFFLKVQAGPLLSLDPASDNFWRMEPKTYPYGSAAFGLAF
ncbi:MAG: hypothetical protein WKF91_14035 [Segetibacter sp.]